VKYLLQELQLLLVQWRMFNTRTKIIHLKFIQNTNQENLLTKSSMKCLIFKKVEKLILSVG